MALGQAAIHGTFTAERDLAARNWIRQ